MLAETFQFALEWYQQNELLPFSDSSDRFKHELVQSKVYDFWTANEVIMQN